jgi:hypothetical protein
MSTEGIGDREGDAIFCKKNSHFKVLCFQIKLCSYHPAVKLCT